MKKLLLFAAIFMVVFASCHKDADSPKRSFHVEGIRDLSLVKGSLTRDTISLALSLVQDLDAPEQVALSLENVPSGLHYTIVNPAGMPGFSSHIYFADSGVVEGNYNIRLVANGDRTGRLELVIHIEVESLPDCSDEVVGRGFVTASDCSPTINYLQDVTAVENTKNKVIFSNIDNNHGRLIANVACEGHRLIIPTQVVNGIRYQGEGGFANSNNQRILGLTLQRNNGGTITECTYRVVR